MIYRALRPLIFRLPAEAAHGLTLSALSLMPGRDGPHDPRLTTEIAGIRFPSPVGLAAGFDKNGEVPDAMLSLGFGFVEVGTLTPKPQRGNPRPRLFRLVEDEGVINRMGFNNAGQDAACARLQRRARRGIVGVNIGANKDATDRVADYVLGLRTMASVADYLTVNISSPNTPGLRSLQGESELTMLLDALGAARTAGDPPVFLKLAPDLTPAEVDATVKICIGRVDALIVGNTTVSRPPLASKWQAEVGGLSGAPLRSLAAERLRDFRKATGGEIPLIAAGGIDSGAEAYARIRSGASLVQLYSGLVFHGPGLARSINAGLAALLAGDGFASIGDAVGVDA